MVGRGLEAPLHVQVEDAGVLVLSGGPTADFNLALLDTGPADEVLLRSFVDRTRALNVAATFMLSSAAHTALADVARASGLKHVGDAPLMLLSSAPSSIFDSHPFAIEHVTTPERLACVADLVSEAFVLDRDWVGRVFAAPSLLTTPDIHYFLAVRDGEPFSTVTTTTSGDGLIGIWNMATPPGKQHHGAGRAVLHAAVQYHRRAHFYLIATSAGKHLYDTTGFSVVDTLAIWLTSSGDQATAH
jgi:hypothetical protein